MMHIRQYIPCLTLVISTILSGYPALAWADHNPELSPVSHSLLTIFILLGLLIVSIVTILQLKRRFSSYQKTVQLLEDERKFTATEIKDLALHKHMFEEIISRSRDGFIRRGLDGTFIEANNALLDMVGYSKEEVINTGIDHILPNDWETWNRIKTIKDQVLSKGFSDLYVTEFKRKDGTTFTAELRTYLLRDQDGVPIEICSFVRDITYIQENEISLQATINELELILDSSPDGMRITNANNDIVRVNKAFACMVNKPKNELQGKACSPFSTEDHCHTDLPLEKLFKDGDQVFAPETKIIIDDREYYCDLSSTAIRGADNTIVGMISDFHDLTQRHKIESALRVSESRFRAFFEASRDSILIMDLDGTIIDCNKSARDIFGINEQSEVIGRTFNDLSPIRQSDGRKSEDKAHEWFSSTEMIGSSFFEWHLKKADSIVFPAEVLLSTLELSGVTFFHGVIRNISDRKAAESAREESERRLELALEATDEGILDWDFSKNKFYFSSRFFYMLGYTHDDFPPTYKGYLDLIHPEDRRKFEKEFNTFIEGNLESFSAEVRVAKRDRDWLWILCRCKAVKYNKNGTVSRVIGSNVNIHELKAIEGALRKSEEDYRTLIESANSIIMRVGTDGTILFINSFAEQFLGHPIAEAPNLSLFSLFPMGPGYNPTVEDIIGKISLHPEAETSSSAGIKRWINWSAKTITNNLGQTKEYLFVGQDITAKRKAEEHAKQQHEQLLQADKLKSLGTLVAGVAHEINNPNSFIMLNTPILKEMWEEIIPVIKEYSQEKKKNNIGRYPLKRVVDRVPLLLTGIADGSQRIMDIVANLKDFSRQEPEEKGQQINVNEIVQAAVELVNNKIKHSTKQFHVELTQEMPTLWGSFQKLEQVVINLLINASEALTDYNQKITLTTTYDHSVDTIFLTVTDEGVGIETDELNQIFDPFFTTKREKGGTGLGLSISSGIVEEHGGTIDFHSQPGEGTSVTINLPRDRRQLS